MEIFRDTAPSLTVDVAGATEVTATVIRDGIDIHEVDGDNFVLPFKVIGYDGPFQVRWDFFVPGDTTLHTRYESHDVVTPLIPDLDRDVEDDVKAERLVRRLIQSLTGTTFGYAYGSKVAVGTGGNILNLPDRLIRLDGVSTNVYPFDVIPFGLVAITNGGYSITTGQGKRYYTVKEMPPEEAEFYSSNGAIVAPGYVHHWANGRSYLITGSWGYEGVPEDVSEAAQLLIDDYGCDEAAYRDKFIDNMRSADWRIEYSGLTWQGTGNIKADQLLAPYIRSGIGVV